MNKSRPTSSPSVRALTLMVVALLGSKIGFAQATDPETTPPPKPAEAVELPAFTVDSSKETGYIGSNSLSASRASLPVADLPSSVIVITRKLIDDIGAFSVYDALHYVSGVTDSSIPAQDSLSFKIRGTGATVATDGFRVTGEGTVDLAEIDHIEVLKGPSAILFAQGGSAGGTVNRVTKNPLDVAQGYVKIGAGKYDANRIEADSTGPVPFTDGKLLYRLVMAYQDSDGYFENTYNKRFIVDPALTYKFTADNYVTAKFSYQKTEQTQYVGVPMNNATNLTDFQLEDHLYPVPIYRTTSDPNETQNTSRYHLDLLSGVKVAPFMRSTLNFQASDTNYTRNVTRPNGTPLVGADGSVPRNWSLSWQHNSRYRLYSDHELEYKIGPTNNLTVFGVDLLEDGIGSQSANATSVNIAPANIFIQPPAVSPTPNISYTRIPSSYTDSAQAYVMETMKALKDHLILSGGFTRNWVQVNNYTAATSTWNIQSLRADTKQYGIIVRPVSWASLYYGYNENFSAQFVRVGILQADGSYADGGAAPPQASVSKEFGFKATTADGRLSASIAHFDTNLNNRTQVIVGTPYVQLQSGGSFKGWESDIFYRPLTNLSLILTGSHTSAVDMNGKLLDSVAANTASALIRYDIAKGWFKNLGATLSESYQSKYIITPYWVKPHKITSAGLFYKWKEYRAQVNIDNLTNARYISGGFLPQRVYLGTGREIRFSASYGW